MNQPLNKILELIQMQEKGWKEIHRQGSGMLVLVVRGEGIELRKDYLAPHFLWGERMTDTRLLEILSSRLIV